MRKTKQEKYAAALEAAKQRIRELERSGVKTIPIELAASLLPTLVEYQ